MSRRPNPKPARQLTSSRTPASREQSRKATSVTAVTHAQPSAQATKTTTGAENHRLGHELLAGAVEVGGVVGGFGAQEGVSQLVR
jgi:hypothetical protein